MVCGVRKGDGKDMLVRLTVVQGRLGGTGRRLEAVHVFFVEGTAFLSEQGLAKDFVGSFVCPGDIEIPVHHADRVVNGVQNRLQFLFIIFEGLVG